MAVNLINSDDTTISRTNDEIKIDFSSTRNTQIQDIENDIDDINDDINDMLPVVLYENASGSNTNITLSDSAANYSYIEIYYTDNHKSIYNFKKIDNPDGKGVILDFISNYKNNSGLYSYLFIKNVQINGNAITKNLETFLQINNTTINNVAEVDYIYITKVVGYK